MIKVAFVSIFYPLMMGRYMLEALLRRDDVEIWTAGPYTGRWIPWAGGMNLPGEYVFQPNHPMPFGQGQPMVSFKMLEKQVPFEPDIWINVSSTLVTHGKPTKGKYVVIAADPHVLDYDKERSKADLFFNMQKPYMKPGDIWLPYGYDPIWHSQTDIPWEDREHDAALLGLNYANRTKLVGQLRGKGYDVAYDVGPCYDDARSIYHSTRVGLNWSSLQDTTARVFEIMAFGIAPVLNHVPDLDAMFTEGEHFMGFDDVNEAVVHVGWCLNNPEVADKMGRQAREAVEPHSWDARMQTVLEEAGLANKDT